MARTTSVNQNDVNLACFRLMADGLDPTFAAVYAELKRKGGKKNVLDAIANWRKSVARDYFATQTTPRYSVTETIRRFEDIMATTLATPVIITRASRDAAVLLSADRFRALVADAERVRQTSPGRTRARSQSPA
jgi:prevent-host-death family protein